MSRCKDCKPPKRHPGCHSQCPIGIQEAKEAEDRREKRAAAHAADIEKACYMYSNTFRRKHKIGGGR